MPSVKRTFSEFWEEHRKAMLVAATVTCGLLFSLISLAVAAEPLKVGGLPVT
jgi:hypothetical protein